MQIFINRFKITDNYTLGDCYIKDNNNCVIFKSVSIERGWKDNQNKISCVSEGNYKVVLEYSPKFNMKLWELKDVPNRAECKFHIANYWYQLNGCIALGEKHKDINFDGDPDVTNSRITLREFNNILKDLKECTLIIKNI